jgi:hypothetical protein
MYVCETAYVYWFGNVAFINCEANSNSLKSVIYVAKFENEHEIKYL